MKTATEFQSDQQKNHLCFRCKHYEVCEMASAVVRIEGDARLRHYVVISQCAHHELEGAHLDTGAEVIR